MIANRRAISVSVVRAAGSAAGFAKRRNYHGTRLFLVVLSADMVRIYHVDECGLVVIQLAEPQVDVAGGRVGGVAVVLRALGHILPLFFRRPGDDVVITLFAHGPALPARTMPRYRADAPLR